MSPPPNRAAWRLTAVGGAVLALLVGCSGDDRESGEAALEDRPPLVARATIEPPSATVGDQVVYALEVEHDPDLTISWPEVGEVLGGLRVLGQGLDEPRRRGGRVHQRRWVRLQAVRPGSFEVPALTVESASEGQEAGSGPSAEAPATALEVASVLPADSPEHEIRDIKPLVPPRPRWWRWTALAVLVAAALAALVAAWRWLRRRREAVVPAVPAHERALLELEELARLDLTDPRMARRYGFRVSEVVRTYVEGRWGLNATDLTREEILARMGELGELPGGEASRLEGFLEGTDRVKYTGGHGALDELRRIHSDALGFVRATQPRETEDVASG